MFRIDYSWFDGTGVTSFLNQSIFQIYNTDIQDVCLSALLFTSSRCQKSTHALSNRLNLKDFQIFFIEGFVWKHSVEGFRPVQTISIGRTHIDTDSIFQSTNQLSKQANSLEKQQCSVGNFQRYSMEMLFFVMVNAAIRFKNNDIFVMQHCTGSKYLSLLTCSFLSSLMHPEL